MQEAEMILRSDLCDGGYRIVGPPNKDGPLQPRAENGPSDDDEEATNDLDVLASTPRPVQAMKVRNPMWQAVSSGIADRRR